MSSKSGQETIDEKQIRSGDNWRVANQAMRQLMSSKSGQETIDKKQIRSRDNLWVAKQAKRQLTRIKSGQGTIDESQIKLIVVKWKRMSNQSGQKTIDELSRWF